MSNLHITHILYSINRTNQVRNEKEVLVSFKYRGLQFNYPINVKIILDKNDDYYLKEAKVIFNADVKSGKLNEYLNNYSSLFHRKKHSSLSLFVLLVTVITSIMITPIFIACSNRPQDITVEVPKINGLNFSNLNAKIGQDFLTNITVNPAETNGKGLPSALTSVKSGNYEIKNNEYIYILNADKVNASLKIPGTYVKGNTIVNFNLTDAITYTVSFDLNGGTGDTPSQTFNYNDKERLVEEPNIPTYSDYDFIGWYLTDTEIYDFSSNVNSDLILHAHWDLNRQDAVTATKGNMIKSYHTLSDFKDAVNNNSDNIDGFDGWIVTLNEYINLHNEEWTPIGTSEHPFKGIFNGNNKAVYNYKIVENKTTPDSTIKSLGGGLFGYVEGRSSILHNNSPLTDFYNSTTYEVTPPEENTFSCIIKNLKLRNVETIKGSCVNDEDYTGALASSIKNVYISNVKLNSSTINADNKVGGIIGIVVKEGVAIFNNLITAKTVTVNGNGNHVAGIYSRVNGSDERVLTLNCINNAMIDGKGTNTGGITGQSKYTLFNNCVNNGTIKGASRTAGIGTDIMESTFIGCINNGNVSQTNLAYQEAESNAPGGIASYASTYNVSLYKCKNAGTIGTGDNKKTTAGIISTGVSQNSTIKNCINIGTILSTHAYDICELAEVPTIKTETSLSNLNAHLQNNKYIIDDNIILTDTDKTLIPSEWQEKIELNNLSGNIIIDLANANSNFTLDIDNCDVSIINGDDSKNIKIIGGGNNITIDSNINDVYLSNNSDSKLVATINHASNKIVFAGTSKIECKIEKNTSVDCVSFLDTGTFTLINEGIISHKVVSGGNEHTVSSISKCNITIYNYGTIETKESDSHINAYALLFYYGSLVTIYAGNQSYVKSSGNYILAAESAEHVYIYYKKGAKMVKGNEEQDFIITGSNITSEPWTN